MIQASREKYMERSGNMTFLFFTLSFYLDIQYSWNAKEDLLNRAKNGFVRCWLLLMLDFSYMLSSGLSCILGEDKLYLAPDLTVLNTMSTFGPWISSMSKRVIQFWYHSLGIWQIYNTLLGGTYLFHLDPPNKLSSDPASLHSFLVLMSSKI